MQNVFTLNLKTLNTAKCKNCILNRFWRKRFILS